MRHQLHTAFAGTDIHTPAALQVVGRTAGGCASYLDVGRAPTCDDAFVSVSGTLNRWSFEPAANGTFRIRSNVSLAGVPVSELPCKPTCVAACGQLPRPCIVWHRCAARRAAWRHTLALACPASQRLGAGLLDWASTRQATLLG